MSLNLPGDQMHPRLSLGHAGGYVVWEDNMTDGDGLGISARMVNNYLSPVPQRTFRVNQQGVGDQERPAVQSFDNGGAVFVWQSGTSGSQDIYARFLAADGTFATGDVLVNTTTAGQQGNAVVALLQDGNVIVTWTSQGQDGSMEGVYAQRLSPTGQKLGGEFRVNQFTPYNQRSPAVASLSGGGFVVAWISEQQRFENSVDVYIRRFDTSGNPQTGELLVNTTTNVCSGPAIGAAADGGFLLAWSEMQVDDLTNGWDIFVRRFNADNTPATSPARANVYTRHDQYSPNVSSIGSDFLVVWTSDMQDGSREGVYGRFFRDAAFVGDEFKVNTWAISQQIHPTVASDGTSHFLVVWSSFVGGSGSFELLGQRYSADQSLAQPSPPFVAALDQSQLSVSWPDLAGYTNLADYLVYVDSNSVPVSATGNHCVLADLAPGSVHSIRIAYELSDGSRSPISEAATGKTWGRDSNYDGLPDDWQAQYWGSNPANWPSPLADSDGDGASNLQEFLAGTDPTNPDSVLKLRILSTPQGSRLSWNCQPGFIYQVRISTDITTWSDLGTARFSPGTVDSIPLEALASGTFYRIVRVR